MGDARPTRLMRHESCGHRWKRRPSTDRALLGRCLAEWGKRNGRGEPRPFHRIRALRVFVGRARCLSGVPIMSNVRAQTVLYCSHSDFSLRWRREDKSAHRFWCTGCSILYRIHSRDVPSLGLPAGGFAPKPLPAGKRAGGKRRPLTTGPHTFLSMENPHMISAKRLYQLPPSPCSWRPGAWPPPPARVGTRGVRRRGTAKARFT